MSQGVPQFLKVIEIACITPVKREVEESADVRVDMKGLLDIGTQRPVGIVPLVPKAREVDLPVVDTPAKQQVQAPGRFVGVSAASRYAALTRPMRSPHSAAGS